MRSLCRPTNDLLISGVLSSSVAIASDQCLESRGFYSHLELNFFSRVLLFIYIILVITTIKPSRNWKQWLCKIWKDKQRAFVTINRFTSLPCNLLHSIFETRLHSSPLHKYNVGCTSPSYSNNY